MSLTAADRRHAFSHHLRLWVEMKLCNDSERPHSQQCGDVVDNLSDILLCEGRCVAAARDLVESWMTPSTWAIDDRRCLNRRRFDWRRHDLAEYRVKLSGLTRRSRNRRFSQEGCLTIQVNQECNAESTMLQRRMMNLMLLVSTAVSRARPRSSLLLRYLVAVSVVVGRLGSW